MNEVKSEVDFCPSSQKNGVRVEKNSGSRKHRPEDPEPRRDLPFLLND